MALLAEYIRTWPWPNSLNYLVLLLLAKGPFRRLKQGELRPLNRCYVKIEIHLQSLVYILLLPTPKSKWRRVIVVPASQQLSIYNLESPHHGTLYIFGDCTTAKSLYLAE